MKKGSSSTKWRTASVGKAHNGQATSSPSSSLASYQTFADHLPTSSSSSLLAFYMGDIIGLVAVISYRPRQHGLLHSGDKSINKLAPPCNTNTSSLWWWHSRRYNHNTLGFRAIIKANYISLPPDIVGKRREAAFEFCWNDAGAPARQKKKKKSNGFIFLLARPHL